jgi:hypothetical protein
MGPVKTCVEKHVENKTWSCQNCVKIHVGSGKQRAKKQIGRAKNARKISTTREQKSTACLCSVFAGFVGVDFFRVSWICFARFSRGQYCFSRVASRCPRVFSALCSHGRIFVFRWLSARVFARPVGARLCRWGVEVGRSAPELSRVLQLLKGGGSPVGSPGWRGWGGVWWPLLGLDCGWPRALGACRAAARGGGSASRVIFTSFVCSGNIFLH